MLKRVSGALVAVAPGLFALPAHAEVPAAVTTALSGMQADALAVAGLVLGMGSIRGSMTGGTVVAGLITGCGSGSS